MNERISKHMDMLFDALSKDGFTDDQIDLIREGNAKRFLKDAML